MNSFVGIVFILVFVNSIFLAEALFLLTDKIDRDDFSHQNDQSSEHDDHRRESSGGYLSSFSDIELLFDSQNSLLQELLSGQMSLKKQNENFMKKYKSLRRYLKRINSACACRSQQIHKAIHTEAERSITRTSLKQDSRNHATSKRRKENVKETNGASFFSSIYQKGAVGEGEIKSGDYDRVFHLSENSNKSGDERYDKHNQPGTAADVKPRFHDVVSTSFESLQEQKSLHVERELHISTPNTTDIHRKKLLRKNARQQVHYGSSVNHGYQQPQKTDKNQIEIADIPRKHSALSSIDNNPSYNDQFLNTMRQTPKSNELYSTTGRSLLEGVRGHTDTPAPKLVPTGAGETGTTIDTRSLYLTSDDKASRNDPTEKYNFESVQNNMFSRSTHSKSTVDPKDKLQVVKKTSFVHSVDVTEKPNNNLNETSDDNDFKSEFGHDLTEKPNILESTDLHSNNNLKTRNRDHIFSQQIHEPNVQAHLYDYVTSTIKPRVREKVTDDNMRTNGFQSYVHNRRQDSDDDTTNNHVETKNSYSDVLKTKKYNVIEQGGKGQDLVREDDDVSNVDSNGGEGKQYIGISDGSHSKKQIDKINRAVGKKANSNIYKNIYFNENPTKEIIKDEIEQGDVGAHNQTNHANDVSNHGGDKRSDKATTVLENSEAPGASKFEITTKQMVQPLTLGNTGLYDDLETGSVKKSVKQKNMAHGPIIENHINTDDQSNVNRMTTTRNAIDTNDNVVTFSYTDVEHKHNSKTHKNVLNKFDEDVAEIRDNDINNGFNLFDELKSGKHGVKWNYLDQENSLKREITPTTGSKQTLNSDKQASIGASTSNQTSYDTRNNETGGRGQSSRVNNNVPVRGGFYDLEVDLSTGRYRGNHFAISWVSNLTRGVSEKCGVQGVVQLSFPYTLLDEVQETIMIDMWFDTPTSWIFNIGDSRSNDGFSGDAGTQENDCEAEGHGTTFAVHGSDKSRDPLNKLLKIEQDFLNKTASFLVTNEQISWRGQDESDYTQLKDKNLFALKGQSDRQGSVNYDVFVSMNRVIAGNYRQGHGLCWIGFKWLTVAK